MSSEIKGIFQITGWEENSILEFDDGSKQSHAKVDQLYTGSIVGTSEVNYLMSYRPDGTAVFVGFEKITGKLNGESGSIVLQHNGIFESGVAKSEFSVVTGTSQEGFKNIENSGKFASTDNGKANYEILVKA